MPRDYQICARCVMDTSDPEIQFDGNAVCNHCRRYETLIEEHVFTGEEGRGKLALIVDQIKKDGKGKEYDSVLGLSGGSDSTYVAYLARQLGLTPYLTALDNGYDAEVTKRNVQKIARYLNTELHVYTIDPDEFRDLQLAYLKSGVLNIEVLSDHAILAVLYETAAKLGVKYVLSGQNIVTEGILAASWGHDNRDLVNILDIYRKHGSGRKLKTFPQLSVAGFLYYYYFKKIRFVTPLNYVPYVQTDAKALFAREFGYEDYGAKHAESIFTRFYQFYMLPTRLHVDKRRAHLSCLVMSGQMSREDALRELEKPPYEKERLQEDKQFVLRRLGLSEDQFESFLSQPIRSHLEYRTDRRTMQLLTFGLRQWGAIRGIVARAKALPGRIRRSDSA